jgi:hypothetical protein
MKREMNIPVIFHAGFRGLSWAIATTISLLVVLFAAWSSCCLWQGVVVAAHTLA